MTEPETKQPEPATSNQGVQLGIGTLIIIALIVTMCSGRSEIEKVQRDTRDLKQQLGVTESKLDALAAQSKTPPPTEPTTAPPDAAVERATNP
jgi:hypothetical protein